MKSSPSSHDVVTATQVILVDGVGHAAKYPRVKDCLTIVIGDVSFVKTTDVLEGFEGFEIYRQEGMGSPTIRRVADAVMLARDAGSS